MRSFRRIALVLVVATTTGVALLILHPAVAAPGDLDPSFGAGGTVETPIGTTASATGVAVQSDGKIVAGGTSSVRSGNNYLSAFALARYLPNGTLDASFGSGGVSTGPAVGPPRSPSSRTVAS